MHQLQTTRWIRSTDRLEQLLEQPEAVQCTPMNSGLEGEVTKLTCADDHFVWKVWNKTSKPDINRQFLLLQALKEHGVSVSEPIGIGIDPDGNAVLLTSYDGDPPQKPDKLMLSNLAERLVELHRMPVDGISADVLPTYDFIDYFFPHITNHPDLHERVTSLVERVSYRHDRLIHGDYNLGNVVFSSENCTIIDWTNGQRGDWRYDFAWSAALMRIYASDRLEAIFRSAYLVSHPMLPEEQQAFEAIAVLRWLLLNRLVKLNNKPQTNRIVRHIIANNPDLAGIKL